MFFLFQHTLMKIESELCSFSNKGKNTNKKKNNRIGVSTDEIRVETTYNFYPNQPSLSKLRY